MARSTVSRSAAARRHNRMVAQRFKVQNQQAAARLSTHYSRTNPMLQGVEALALKAKRNIEANRNRVVGADGAISLYSVRNKDRRKVPLRVSYELGSFSRDGAIEAVIVALGPWALVEYDMPAHTIQANVKFGKEESRYARALGATRRDIRQLEYDLLFGARGVRKKVIRMETPRFGFRQQVRHPGTRGRLPFHRGLERAEREAGRTLAQPTMDMVRQVFR